jgi:hypothetical protein
MDRLLGVERRSARRESTLLELQKQVPPVDAGDGFELRLADKRVRWFPHADGRSPRSEKRAPEGQGRGDGPERGTSLAEKLSAQGHTRVFIARSHVFQAERGASVVERCIFLSWTRIVGAEWRASVVETRIFLRRTRIFQARWRASVSRRCGFLCRSRIFRSRAIAVVIVRRIFQALADPKTSPTHVSPASACLGQPRSTASPRGARIFQARRCTGRRGRALFLKK